MAVKASVDTQNQTTVRVGQQNAIKVTSTQTGIASAVNATNIVGGRADVTQLAVSGLSTFTGIGTFVSDLYVGGDLYLTDDLVLDNISGSSLNISGVSTVGFITATDVWVSGAVTATTYYGDGSNLTGLTGTANTSYVSTNSLVVLGISTIGVTSATDLEAQQLSVSGISTFNEDVVFTGANTNARWDHSTSDLILFDNTRLEFGSNKDFEIWHGGSHTFMKNSGGDLRIRGDIIKLAREDGSERYLEANVNNEVKLFFNGNEKFATTLQGVEIGTVAISTVGFITATDVYVSGISTLGVTSATDLEAQQLSVSGVSTFSADIEAKDDVTIDGQLFVASNIKHKGDTDTYIEFTADKLRFITGGKEFINVTQSGASSVVINEQPDYDCDFRVEGISDEYLIFTDAVTDKVGIGSAIPKAKLDVNGTLNVSGITTFAGITTVTGNILFTKQLSVSGLSTYIGVATYKNDVFIDGTLTAGVIDGGTY